MLDVSLLVVALKLLRLVAAAGLALPGAVVQPVGTRNGRLVEGVIPGLTIAVLAPQGERSGERKIVHGLLVHVHLIEVLGHHVGCKLAGVPEYMSRVRGWNCTCGGRKCTCGRENSDWGGNAKDANPTT